MWIEHKILLESIGKVEIIYDSMSAKQQETMAETARLISIECYKDLSNQDLYQDLFMICRHIIMKGILEFDLGKVIELYGNFRDSDFYNEREKVQNFSRVWFESEMMEVFLESVTEEKIRK
jgi:hypothetical protein